METDKTYPMVDAIGDRTRIYSGVEFFIKNKQADGRGIRIGSDCVIYNRNRFVLGDLAYNPKADLVIGNHVHINAGGYLSAEGGLCIEDYVLIGPGVFILSAGHQYHDLTKHIQQQPLSYGTIRIGTGAWIGAGAVIREGIVVGEGAVVGAAAVVTGDVPPYAIVVGHPGKIVKYRGKAEKKRGIFSRFFGRR
jgi:acetyltransferase-like isoleucine patch superfamily enzyme